MRLFHLARLSLALPLVSACLAEPGTVEPGADGAADTAQVAPDTRVPDPAPDTRTPDAAADTSVAEPDTTVAEPETTVADTDPGKPDAVVTNPFVVHEWGTFTSVQDARGKSHPGLHHEDEALPPWVYRRDVGPNAYFEQLPEEPLQQLETPVIYFHAAEATDVKVEVDFPEGIISQWYPGATSYAPMPYQMSAIADGTMTWDLEVDPAIDADLYLPVSPEEIWAPSRNVASTPVRFVNELGAEELEQFIFYRGLGSFDLPVRVTAGADGELEIHNDSPDALGAIVILNVSDAGGAVASIGSLPAGETRRAAIPEVAEPWSIYSGKAHAALKAAVMTTGLYDDEAEAMVDTWTRSWFGNRGVRVLYLVPRSWTDRLLPIRVTPAPTELVRTLVGRIEVLTPAVEAKTWAAIQQLGDQPTWELMEKVIDELGRFAEPQIRQALDAHGDHQGGRWLLEQAHQRP